MATPARGSPPWSGTEEECGVKRVGSIGELLTLADDNYDMDRSCARMRKLMSAELDGETGGVESRVVQAHLTECPDCASWISDARRATRRVVVSGAPTPPDVTGAVMARLTEQRPRDKFRGSLARTLLVSLAFVQLYLAFTSLLVTDGHLGRDMWAFEIALALAVLFVALRPWRAAGLFPLLAGLSGLLLLTGGSDLVRGLTTAWQELPHVIVILQFLVIWRLRNRPGPLGSLPPAPSGIENPHIRRVA